MSTPSPLGDSPAPLSDAPPSANNPEHTVRVAESIRKMEADGQRLVAFITVNTQLLQGHERELITAFRMQLVDATSQVHAMYDFKLLPFDVLLCAELANDRQRDNWLIARLYEGLLAISSKMPVVDTHP